MNNLEKIKIHRLVRENGETRALYSGWMKSYTYHSRTHKNNYIGSFSKSEWKKIRIQQAIYYVVKNLFWIAGLIGLGLFVSAFTIFASSLFFGVVSMLLGIVGVILAIVDLMERSVDEFLGKQILEKLKLIPESPDAEVCIDGFVRGDSDAVTDRLKNLSKDDFVEVAETFDKWIKTNNAYDRLRKQAIHESNYGDDADLLNYLDRKKIALYEKMRENKIKADELVNKAAKDSRQLELIKVLQETDEILAS